MKEEEKQHSPKSENEKRVLSLADLSLKNGYWKFFKKKENDKWKKS